MVTIRKRIMILLCVLVSSFLAGAITWRAQEKKSADLLAADAQRQKIAFADKIVSLRGRSLETCAYLYTFWDEVVDFVLTRDRKWAEANLVPAMIPFDVDNVWVYNKDWTLVYSANSLKASPIPVLPLPATALRSVLGSQPFCHFFIRTTRGLMEIRGGTIHKTADAARVGPYYGYFLVGHIVSSDYLADLAGLTSSVVQLQDGAGPPAHVNSANGDIIFSIDLRDWDNKPLQHLQFSSRLPIIPLIHNSTARALELFVIFILSLLALLSACLVRWISLPLKSIADCLQTERLELLNGLRTQQTEYGELARLIGEFFEQKQLLIQEIAERKQAQEELSQAQVQLVQAAKLASLGTLSTGVAHELNQPLAVVRGIAQQLKTLQDLPEDLHADLELIEQQTGRMDTIIKHLRDFCDSGSGTPTRLDLNETIYDSLMLVGEQLRSLNIMVELDLSCAPLEIVADAGELEQALLNLLTNARDALEATSDARISVRSRMEAEWAVVEVCDNGSGVPDNIVTRIFDPFFTTKETGKGTGLGLSISHNIALKYHGKLSVRNEGGAVFTLALPAAPAESLQTAA